MLEVAWGLSRRGEGVQDWSDTLLQDKVGKGFIWGRFLFQQTFEAVLCFFLDVAFIPLKEFKLHADYFSFDLNDVEIEFRVQFFACLGHSLVFIRLACVLSLVSLKVLCLSLFDEIVNLGLRHNITDHLKHLASELAVESDIRVDLVKIMHVVI